ncbi:MAG: glycosyltransferase [Caulobacteraceae bacterium]
MIKVMHVLSDMKVGGAGRWLINLLKAADRTKYEVKVVLPVGSLLTDIIKDMGFQTVSVEGMNDKSFDKGTTLALYKLFKKEKPQIVHTHASLSARIAARMAGVKGVVNTKHCLDGIRKGMGGFAGAVLNSRLSDRIIAVSNAVKQNIVESGISGSKVEVIYGGIEDIEEKSDEEKIRLREGLGLSKEDIVVGIVARLSDVKGHIYFIEAADIVSKAAQNVKFVIAGTGPKEAELKELVMKKGLQDRIVFTGYVEEVESIFNIIDINVISSVSEALCLSLIEGMCVGKPCIGTDTGGIPEVVRDGYNGYLVPVREAKELADAILKLVQNPELRKSMGDKGRELVVQNFKADVMARKIEKIYEALI